MQGSGRLVFEDGKQSFVSYESDNGYPFVSLSTLASRDKLKIEGNAGMQGIRNYFTQHPELLSKYAKEMRRYIFFSFKKQAIGTLQVPVVPLRTIAVDPKRIPLGLMGFLKTRQPVLDQNKQLRSFKELSLLVFSHDTGNAITNDHIDLFWGFGDLASVQASSMNERGKLTLLIPKQP
jgi:membrane-bound lytic murein transglycosylase A